MNKQELLAHFADDREEIDASMRRELAGVRDPLLREIVEYTIFSGGKRIRPLLVLFAARLCGLAEPRHGIASAFELLHAATLLHDDVIDHSEQRRGRPSANTIWGETPVILAGDYLHARALQLVGCLGNRQCLEIFCEATATMVEGEFLQLRNARRTDLTEEDYLTVLHGKTGVLIAAACEIGAALAEAPAPWRQGLRAYGTNLGLAFQIVDDLLDYLGDPGKTGKAVGNDFGEGKMTLPLIRAMDTGTPDEQDFLRGLLTGEAADRQRAFARVRILIEERGGFLFSRERAAELIDRALASLAPFPEGIAKELLQGLARYVLSRQR